MKSRAFQECEKIQCRRIAIAEKFKELETREQCTAAVLGDSSDGQLNVHELLALGKATLSVREAARGSEIAKTTPQKTRFRSVNLYKEFPYRSKIE